MFSRSLSRRFIASILSVLFLSQGILIGWGYFQERRALEDTLAQKLSVVGALLANASSKALSDFDFTYLGILCDEAIKDGDITRVVLADDTGLVVIDQHESGNRSSVLQKKVPIVQGGKSLGTLTLMYTTDRIDDVIVLRLLRKGVVQIVIFLCVAFMIYGSFRFSVVRRVRRIERVLGGMSEGDLTIRVDDRGEDELGSIAAGVDQLADRLSASISDLGVVAQNVAAVGAEIGETLRQTSASLAHQHDATEEISRSISSTTQNQTQIAHNARKLLELSRTNATSVTEHLQIAQGIHQRMSGVSDDMTRTLESVRQLRESAGKVSGLAARAAGEVESAVLASQDIRSSFGEIERLVDESITLNEQSTELITMEGVAAIGQTRMSMNRILDLSTSLASTIGHLGTRSKDIGKILSAISEITERTKLLSLNASIIAAQAGEHGRGFAVVANEMKQLSDRTAHSTAEIGGILAAIHASIADAVREADEATGIVRQGGEVVGHTATVFEKILSSSRTALDMVKRIHGAALHQQGKLDEIGIALSGLREVNGDVSRASREQNERLEEVSRAFDLLREAVDVVRSATSEQVASMEMVLRNIERSAERTGEIASAVHEAQQSGGAICASLSEVVDVGSKTLEVVQLLAERMSLLVAEVGRLHSQTRTYRLERD